MQATIAAYITEGRSCHHPIILMPSGAAICLAADRLHSFFCKQS
ncbi:hypothetical protein [Microcoleus sp. Pol11C3]